MNKLFTLIIFLTSTAFAQIDVDYMRSGLPNPNWRDPVANSGALPSVNNNTGDVRFSLGDLGLYGWDGSAWQSIVSGGGGSFVPIAGGTMTGTLTLDPAQQTGSNDAATIGQLQSFVSGLVWKSPACMSATTGNINISNPGTDTFDGHQLFLGESLCVFFQSSQTQNGVYIFDTSSTALVRRTDLDSSAELNAATISVQNGATYGGKAFTQVTDVPVIGSDPIVWVNLGNAYLNGAGLDLTGNVFSIATGGIVNSMVNASAAIDFSKMATLGTNQWVYSDASGVIADVALTASRAVVTDGSGLPSVSATTATEIGYVSGATSNIQAQINAISASIVYPIDLTADVSGVLPVANGGTNSGSFTSGSVVFADGTKLTENNNEFFWDNTNFRLGINAGSSPTSALQIGTADATKYSQMDPDAGLIVSGSGANTTRIVAESTFGSSIPAEIAASSRPSGAMGGFEELGWFSFFGRDDAGNQRRGAYIRGITSGAWTSTSLPTHMDFFTVPSGSASEIQRARIHSSGEMYVGSTGLVGSTGTFNIGPLTSAKIGLYIRGQSGQTADLLQVQNNSAVTLMNVEADGDLNARSLKAAGSSGTGFLELNNQFIGILAPSSAIRVFSNGGNLAVKTASPTYTFDHSLLTTSRTFQFQDSDYIIANVPSTPGIVGTDGTQLVSFTTINLNGQVSGTLAVANGGTGASSIPAGFVTSNGTSLSSVSEIDLAADVGATILPVANGGTGQSSFSQGVIVSDGSAMTSLPFVRMSTTATQQTTSTTMISATELTTGTLPVGKYKFSGTVVFQSTVAANGLGFRLGAGTATLTNTYAKWFLSQAANGTAKNYQYDQVNAATNVFSASVQTINTDQVGIVEGVFEVTTPGTVAIQFRSESGSTVSIRAGSIITIQGI